MSAEEKARVRKEAMLRRRAAHDPALGAAACDHLLDFLGPHLGRPASGYLPIRDEIDPLPAMAALSRMGPVGVPVILGAGLPLDFHLWHPESVLVPGVFGTQAPHDAVAMVPELVIVPLLAFDRQGMRLGYGGGFYDRTLAGLRAAGPVLAVGLAYAAQEIPLVPTDATDARLDAIVTENEVIRP